MFVAINQMNYNAKKRKKEKEMDLGLGLEGQDDSGEEMHKGKENIKEITTDTNKENNVKDVKEKLAKEITNNDKILKAKNLTKQEVNNQKTTASANEYSTTPATTTMTKDTPTLTSEPVDNTSASKWKNCQCNLQNDLPHNYERLYLHQPSTNKHHHASDTSSSSSRNPSSPPPNVITSLATVYICLGILTLALASLSVLFYSHVVSCPTNCQNSTFASSAVLCNSHHRQEQQMGQTTSSSSSIIGDEIPKEFSSSESSSSSSTLSLFREQFQKELFASEHVLRSMLEKILSQQQQQTASVKGLNEKQLSLGNLNDQR